MIVEQEMTHTLTRPQPASHAEANALARQELQNFIDLLERLEGDDWQQPTFCTAWNVREIAAHQAGSLFGSSSFWNFVRQSSPSVVNPYSAPGMSLLDKINAAHVGERATHSPPEIIAEIKTVGQITMQTRLNIPALIRGIRAPIPPLGVVAVGYLTDIIYARDMWMHRIDINYATGREMVLTPEHDGRMFELVLYDLSQRFRQPVHFEFTGKIGINWRIGSNPSTSIAMDVLEFCIMVSGRRSLDDCLKQGLIVTNDETATRQMLAEIIQQLQVLW